MKAVKMFVFILNVIDVSCAKLQTVTKMCGHKYKSNFKSSWESFLWDLDIIWLECTPLFPVCNYKLSMMSDSQTNDSSCNFFLNESVKNSWNRLNLAGLKQTQWVNESFRAIMDFFDSYSLTKPQVFFKISNSKRNGSNYCDR